MPPIETWEQRIETDDSGQEAARACISCGVPTLLSGGAHPALAHALACELDLRLVEPEVTTFADGETHVHIEADLRNASAWILQPTCPPVNERVMALALLTDAVRAAGAVSVAAIVPYFGYARQEVRKRIGDPRSAQVIGQLLGEVGVDHLVTVDLHAPALESALPMSVTLLGAEVLFTPRVREWGLPDLVIVSPDSGGMKRAQRFAAALDAPIAVVVKTRPRPDVATPLQVLGDVRGRACVIVDDMASTGRTLVGAADALLAAGAREVHAVFTHAVMAPGAADLMTARAWQILTSDSIPSLGRDLSGAIAPLLAGAVRQLDRFRAAAPPAPVAATRQPCPSSVVRA
jgi:ribose-phosphate pyrophosphokinase